MDEQGDIERENKEDLYTHGNTRGGGGGLSPKL